MTNERELVIHIKLDKEATETNQDVADLLQTFGKFLTEGGGKLEPVSIPSVYPLAHELIDEKGENIGCYYIV